MVGLHRRPAMHIAVCAGNDGSCPSIFRHLVQKGFFWGGSQVLVQ